MSGSRFWKVVSRIRVRPLGRSTVRRAELRAGAELFLGSPVVKKAPRRAQHIGVTLQVIAQAYARPNGFGAEHFDIGAKRILKVSCISGYGGAAAESGLLAQAFFGALSASTCCVPRPRRG